MKYINIDNNERTEDSNDILVTGDFSKIKNDNRNYILHVSPATFMFLRFDRDLELSNIKVCFEDKLDINNLYEFKPIVNTKLTVDEYFTLKTKMKNGYMLLDNNTNPFLCYRGLENSMPMSGPEIWVLVVEGEELEYQFTEEKQISHVQATYNKKGMMIREQLFNDTYLYYNISGNTESYKRVLFSFPSIAAPPVNFRFFDFPDRISEDDLVIAFSDWYGNFGTYMMKNDRREDISSYIREGVRNLYNQYVNEDTEVIFLGFSKGGWIANYFARDFEVDQLWITVPQMDIEHSFSDVIKLNSSYRLNLIYFFKDEDMSKYIHTKLNGKYNQYVYSDLDYASDKGFGKTFAYDRAVVKRTEHNLVNIPVLRAWFQKGESEEIKPEITLFKVNNNLNFNIKVEECQYSPSYRKFASFITCQKTCLDAEMLPTPQNTFVSNNTVDTIFPEHINYYNEPLKLEIYTEDHLYYGNIPPISLDIENNLPDFHIKAYILDITYDEESLHFNYEITCDDLEKMKTLHFVAGTIFFNRLPLGPKGIKTFPKTALKYKSLELGMHIGIENYEILLPFDFSKFKGDNMLKRYTDFYIKDGKLMNKLL